MLVLAQAYCLVYPPLEGRAPCADGRVCSTCAKACREETGNAVMQRRGNTQGVGCTKYTVVRDTSANTGPVFHRSGASGTAVGEAGTEC
jgi:hypothetical protein